jgi:hypothetical protein
MLWQRRIVGQSRIQDSGFRIQEGEEGEVGRLKHDRKKI